MLFYSDDYSSALIGVLVVNNYQDIKYLEKKIEFVFLSENLRPKLGSEKVGQDEKKRQKVTILLCLH